MTQIAPSAVIANTTGPQRTVALKRRRQPRPLCGWIERSTDKKGRITLPCEWKRAIRPPFYLVPRADGRLYVIRAHQWEQLLAGLGRHPLYEDASTVTAAVLVETLQPQARFCIPYHLRLLADLKTCSSIWLIGRGDCFEIISAERLKREVRA